MKEKTSRTVRIYASTYEKIRKLAFDKRVTIAEVIKLAIK
jgi:hypothetical protein